MTNHVKKYELNTAGRDFAVGDIHGCFTRLQLALDGLGFNPECDRLFSVGDLIDRGPESEQVLSWLEKPWFHPVCGNHDDFVCRHHTVDLGNWMQNGGAWFQGILHHEREEYAVQFRELPIAIEVQTSSGKVGILHANIPCKSWDELVSRLGGAQGSELRGLRNFCMWDRSRVDDKDTSWVDGLYRMVVGHTPLQEPMSLGNVIHIDTGGWHKTGYFTLLELGSMKAHCVVGCGND